MSKFFGRSALQYFAAIPARVATCPWWVSLVVALRVPLFSGKICAPFRVDRRCFCTSCFAKFLEHFLRFLGWAVGELCAIAPRLRTPPLPPFKFPRDNFSETQPRPFASGKFPFLHGLSSLFSGCSCPFLGKRTPPFLVLSQARLRWGFFLAR